MFVMTLNKKSIKKIFIGLGCFVLLGVITIAAATLANNTTEAAATGTTAKSTEDMKAYLAGFGIEANIATANVTKVSVPKKWDNDFIAFNEVLVKSGFNLDKFKGKNVDKWVIEATNKSSEGKTAYAILLVRDDKIIGGYLMYQPSGEVMPLNSGDQPETTAQTQTEQTDQQQDTETQTQDTATMQDTTQQVLADNDAQQVIAESDFPTE